MATKPISILLCIVLAIAPSMALAEPPTQNIEVDGAKGIWFPEAKAKKLLLDIDELQGAKQRLKLSMDKEAILRESLSYQKQISEIWKTAAENQAKLMQPESVFKNKTLWLAIGVVLGVATTIGIFAIAKDVGAK